VRRYKLTWDVPRPSQSSAASHRKQSCAKVSRRESGRTRGVETRTGRTPRSERIRAQRGVIARHLAHLCAQALARRRACIKGRRSGRGGQRRGGQGHAKDRGGTRRRHRALDDAHRTHASLGRSVLIACSGKAAALTRTPPARRRGRAAGHVVVAAAGRCAVEEEAGRRPLRRVRRGRWRRASPRRRCGRGAAGRSRRLRGGHVGVAQVLAFEECGADARWQTVWRSGRNAAQKEGVVREKVNKGGRCGRAASCSRSVVDEEG
jgi:hypothetical protein